MKIIVVSGGFDPVHSGHIAYFKAARELGDKLIVALNSDNWLVEKKGSYFMPFIERKLLIENLSLVDSVIDFHDDTRGSASNALTKLKKIYPNDNIIFANGGDRDQTNIPEMSVSGIEFAFGVGGDYKKNSSSWILKKWKYYNENRIWGSFSNLFEEKSVKVKELIVHSGKGTSFQKHFKRSEIWLVSKGSCKVYFSEDSPDNKLDIQLNTFDHFIATKGQWHQITNPFSDSCHIIEIQYGEACVEDDIERIEHDWNKND
jgi:cytidyltransferase-like protein